MVTQSSSALTKAKKSAAGRMSSPAFRRTEEDILILNGLGRYFASLFRAALCYSLFQKHWRQTDCGGKPKVLSQRTRVLESDVGGGEVGLR